MKKLKIFLAGLTLMGLMGFSKLAFANPQKAENVDLITIKSNNPEKAVTDSLNKLKEALKKALDTILPPLSEEEKTAAYNEFLKQVESEAFIKKIVDAVFDKVNKKNEEYFNFVVHAGGKKIDFAICINVFLEQNPVCMEGLKKIAGLA